MSFHLDEHERPSEWLRALREDRAGYVRLMRESGDLIVAAYRVAAARCRAAHQPTNVPTVREVRAAAREVLGDDATPIPPALSVASECAHAGLVVIG
jgi:hypothetical protein